MITQVTWVAAFNIFGTKQSLIRGILQLSAYDKFGAQ